MFQTSFCLKAFGLAIPNVTLSPDNHVSIGISYFWPLFKYHLLQETFADTPL